MRKRSGSAGWLLLLLLLVGCGDDDVSEADGGSGAAGSDAPDGGEPDAAEPVACEPPADAGAAFTGCEQAGDYAPCSDDDWPACVSDDGRYHRIEETISTIARVEAFEQIAELLFDPSADPSPDDFLEARQLYQIDEGIDSRVVRRYDPHFEVPDGTDCTLPEMAAEHPGYCVGPAVLQPALLAAFNDGAAGTRPRVQAATIEGLLLWFYYVSVHKEGLTCTEVAKDCDSAYAYYAGGAEVSGAIGLARYVVEADPYAHQRAWDGILGLRCWRDLDDAEIAGDPELRDRARGQIDRALIDGLASVLRARLEQAAATSSDEQAAHWAFVRALGPALLREAAVRSASDAEALEAALEVVDAADADFDATGATLTALFECP